MAKDRDDSHEINNPDQDLPLNPEDGMEEVEELLESDSGVSLGAEEGEEVEELLESDSGLSLDDQIAEELLDSSSSVSLGEPESQVVEELLESDSGLSFSAEPVAEIPQSDSSVSFSVAQPEVVEELLESDSSLSLGAAEADESDEAKSVVDWAAMIEGREEEGTVSATDVDSPSDKHLLAGLQDSALPEEQEVEEMIEAGIGGVDDSTTGLSELIEAEARDPSNDEIPVVGEIDLGAPGPEGVDESQFVEEEDIVDDESVDLGAFFGDSEPAEVEQPAESVEEILETESGVEISDEIIEVDSGMAIDDEVLETGSGVELGDEVLETESGVELGDEVLETESGVEIGDEIVESESGVEIGDEIVESESGVEIGDEIIEGDSGIAIEDEVVEKASDYEVDFGAVDQTAETEGGEIESGAIAYTPGFDEESPSAVDLGAPGEVNLEEMFGEDEGEGEDDLAAALLQKDEEGESAEDDADEFNQPTTEYDALDIGGEEEVEAGATFDMGEEEEVAVSDEDLFVEDEVIEDVDEDAPTEERKPKKPVKQKSRFGALVGGTTFGVLAGAGTCIGLWLYGVEPPQEWKTALGLPASKTGSPTPGGPGTAPPPVTPAQLPELLRNGDLEKAEEAVKQIDESNPEQVAMRGSYRWRNYLRQQAQANGNINKEDEAVQQAVDDLSKATSPEAQLQLAQIHMMTGDFAQARAILEKGKQEHQQDKRFEAALIRLELIQETAANGQTRGPGLPAALALVLTALQPPDMPPDRTPPSAPPDDQPVSQPEAGFNFWQAVKQSRDQQYSEAIASLKLAQELHRKQRFLRLGKAQNPDSDPTEEIFIRACMELEHYWQLQGKLHGGGYLAADKKDPLPAMDMALKDARAAKDAVAKLVDEKVVENPDLAKGVDQLLTDRKNLAVAQKELDTAKTQLGDLNKQLVEAMKSNDGLKKDLADAKMVIDAALKDLKESKYLDANADAAKLVAGTQMVIQMANEKDPQGKMRMLTQEVAQLKEKNEKDAIALKEMHKKELTALNEKRLGEIKTLETKLSHSRQPAELMPVWVAALEQRDRKTLMDQALVDVNRVKASPDAPAEVKAQATVVQGLIMRNAFQYPEALATLKPVVEILPQDSVFRQAADMTIQEASNPAAFFGTKAQKLAREGDLNGAQEMLTRLIEVVPEKEPLLLKRSQLLLEEAVVRSGGRPQANDPAIMTAREDATAAEQAGLAEAFYISGRIAEATGQRELAIAKYREAVNRHPVLDEQGGKYRAALARLLVRPTEIQAPATPLLPPPGPVGMLPFAREMAAVIKAEQAGSPEAKAEAADRLRTLFALALVSFQAPWEQLSPQQEEALRLADQILQAEKGAVSSQALAMAYAIKGLWPQAFNAFAQGAQKGMNREDADVLLFLVRNFPALQAPVAEKPVDLLEAERLYATGLRFFFGRNYPEAERHLLQAIEEYEQDARYYYFLGLSRMAQGNRTAAEADFEKGAQLEQLNLPGRAAVSTALERVQGNERRILNETREKAR